MLARLPEQDEQESLQQSAREVEPEGAIVRTDQCSKDRFLKFMIIAGLAIVITILLSSHQKTRTIHILSIKDPYAKKAIKQISAQSREAYPLKQNIETTKRSDVVIPQKNPQNHLNKIKQFPDDLAQQFQQKKDQSNRQITLNLQQKHNKKSVETILKSSNNFSEQPQINKQQQDKKMNQISSITQQQKQATFASQKTIEEFIIPRYVWTYSQQHQNNSFFVSKCIENIKYYSNQQSFQMNILNANNYKNFLTTNTADQVAKTISVLSERLVKQPHSNLKEYFEIIKKRLISFHVLNENGGIFIEKNVIFTQSFQWLKKIEDNIYVNKGKGRVKAKYFGFFDINNGYYKRHNKTGITYETEKYMVEFPIVEPYFFAAQARQQYLTEVMSEYVDLLINPASLPQKIKKYKINQSAFHGNGFYFQILYICHQLVLRRKQQQINHSGANRLDNTFAIDQYGLLTMNQRYFPKKLDFFFEKNYQEKIYWNLAKYTLQEMEGTTGPMRYIVCMTLEERINDILQKAHNLQEKYFIHPQSFIGKFIIRNASEPYILKEYEKGVVNLEAKGWSKLPKIIWFYWDKGLEKSSIVNRLCVDNIRREAAMNNFQVKQLNESNIEDYIGTKMNERINNYIKSAKVQTYPQTRSDFVRLAIIAKYGGIYMDASYFAVGGLEWILSIARAPSESVFNRYGELPRVLMFFHPHYGSPFDWTFDPRANTKRLVLSAYENNLLVAEPDQPLFWDWLAEFAKFVTTPYEQTQQQMKEIGVWDYRWTSREDMYLAAMDSIKNVVAKKNKEIFDKINQDKNYDGPKSAAQFYGIWSVSGYRGQQKLRGHTNYDNTFSSRLNYQSIYLWRYSQNYVQGLLGNVSYLIKLYRWTVKQVNSFLLQNYDSNFTYELHPQSYFAKYIYKPQLHKLTRHGEQLFLEFVKV